MIDDEFLFDNPYIMIFKNWQLLHSVRKLFTGLAAAALIA